MWCRSGGAAAHTGLMATISALGLPAVHRWPIWAGGPAGPARCRERPAPLPTTHATPTPGLLALDMCMSSTAPGVTGTTAVCASCLATDGGAWLCIWVRAVICVVSFCRCKNHMNRTPCMTVMREACYDTSAWQSIPAWLSTHTALSSSTGR